MPNWCYNMLRIEVRNDKGKQQLAEFMARAKGKHTDLSLENFLPTPRELLDQPSPCRDPDRAADNTVRYGAPDWYDWRLANWGTKGDVRARLVFEHSDLAEFEFDSAWAPPTFWLKTVSRLFPDLSFGLRYHEDNCCFMGFALARNGVLKNLALDYSHLFSHEESPKDDAGLMLVEDLLQSLEPPFDNRLGRDFTHALDK